ncbi:hypothetical protein QVD17_33761 [Tagetes erecta]|uniref:F-box domain-containing protein n=1 Tax=Tagetes erecta TaxID=13708 RepID=A0AAD8JXQ8_TARER|nr:hypothetical protein QVD17_33761 [Tagetes erecta]
MRRRQLVDNFKARVLSRQRHKGFDQGKCLGGGGWGCFRSRKETLARAIEHESFETQMAFLALSKHVDAAITEYSDLIPYGGLRVECVVKEGSLFDGIYNPKSFKPEGANEGSTLKRKFSSVNDKGLDQRYLRVDQSLANQGVCIIFYLDDQKHATRKFSIVDDSALKQNMNRRYMRTDQSSAGQGVCNFDLDDKKMQPTKEEKKLYYISHARKYSEKSLLKFLSVLSSSGSHASRGMANMGALGDNVLFEIAKRLDVLELNRLRRAGKNYRRMNNANDEGWIRVVCEDEYSIAIYLHDYAMQLDRAHIHLVKVWQSVPAFRCSVGCLCTWLILLNLWTNRWRLLLFPGGFVMDDYTAYKSRSTDPFVESNTDLRNEAFAMVGLTLPGHGQQVRIYTCNEGYMLAMEVNGNARVFRIRRAVLFRIQMNGDRYQVLSSVTDEYVNLSMMIGRLRGRIPNRRYWGHALLRYNLQSREWDSTIHMEPLYQSEFTSSVFYTRPRAMLH